MQRRWHAQIHEVHPGVSEHFVEGTIDLQLPAQVEVTRAADIARYSRKHSVDRQAY